MTPQRRERLRTRGIPLIQDAVALLVVVAIGVALIVAWIDALP